MAANFRCRITTFTVRWVKSCAPFGASSPHLSPRAHPPASRLARRLSQAPADETIVYAAQDNGVDFAAQVLDNGITRMQIILSSSDDPHSFTDELGTGVSRGVLSYEPQTGSRPSDASTSAPQRTPELSTTVIVVSHQSVWRV